MNYLELITECLPDGSAVEKYPNVPEVFVISLPGHGFVSIDVGDRSFSPGWCVPRYSVIHITTAHKGQGWVRKLVEEAVNSDNWVR